MADITHIYKATLKTIQTRNKALGRIYREGSSQSQEFLGLSVPSMHKTNKHAKSEFIVRAKEIVAKITKLRDFLLRHRIDYINIHNHLIFDKVRSMSDTERDQVDSNAQAVMRSCGEDIKNMRIELARQNISRQIEEHRVLMLASIDQYMRIVCKIYSEMKAVRVKRVLDRKRLSRIGGESKETFGSDGSGKVVFDGERVGVNGPVMADESTPPGNVAAGVVTQHNGKPDSGPSPPSSPLPTSQNDAPSERNMTWASSSFDEDDDPRAVHLSESLSPEELQMFEQENVSLYQELQETTDDVKKIEGKVIEIARLQEIFSEKILEQAGDINRIGENLMGTTDNIQMANEQIRDAIKNNAGFRVWILFFLVVMTFSLLFLDWYND